MRKSRSEVDNDLSHLPIFGEDDEDVGHFLGDTRPMRAQGDAPGRDLAARQRVELRNEQRSLREQLSDWDDYGDDLDTGL